MIDCVHVSDRLCAAREEGQAWYVGGLQGVVGVNPVCILEGVYE